MTLTQVLSSHEAAIIAAFSSKDEELTLAQIAMSAGIELAQARSAVERLKQKEAVAQTAERISTTISLSDLGEECRQQQLPELRLLAVLQEFGAVSIAALQDRHDMDRSEAGASFGALRRASVLLIEGSTVRLAPTADLSLWHAHQTLIERVDAAGALTRDMLGVEENAWLEDKRFRQMFKLVEHKQRTYQLTSQGNELRAQAAESRSAIGRLTPEMLRDGSWRERRFQPYHIDLPPRVVYGSRNEYRRFLDHVKQTLLGLGFAEMRGSLVENEFWDMDALFMPQYHPAREIHDVYFVADPTHAASIPEPYLSNVAAAHEGTTASGSKGWGYVFDRQRAHRLILRSQGTALSARMLATQPNIPGKYFSMARCFRYDAVDATHAPDFIQIEGIVLSQAITLRHLLGILSLFAKELAQAKEIKATPAYFPFTEPSVEMSMLHPGLGWIELGGAGIFRPEVTESLGVDVPVIAWGLGLDRMAMVALDKDDIRHLFTNNLPRGLADTRRF